MLRCIGLMSGTSMDGIDGAIIETDGTPKQILFHETYYLSYDKHFKILLKAAEAAIKNAKGDLLEAEIKFPDVLRHYLEHIVKVQNVNAYINKLAAYLANKEHSDHFPLSIEKIIQHSTYLHSVVVNELLRKAMLNPADIDVVGYHGQTMFHSPSTGVSQIVGDGQALAQMVGITVVNDFRSRDVKAGGQGAPFAPLYHQALAIRDECTPLAVINCGGIANITIIPDEKEEHLIGFDTGPGNGLIDLFVRTKTNNKEQCDYNGNYGKQGKVHEDVLQALFQRAIIKDDKNYFLLPPPKSLDIGDMQLIQEVLHPLSFEDACRTLEAFTAYTIVKSIEHLKENRPEINVPKCIVLVGGGWNNPVILQELTERAQIAFGTDIKVLTAGKLNWDSQAMEAQIFAYLAARSLSGQPLSYPNTTGVPEPLSGGHAYQPQLPAKPTKKVKKLLTANPAVLSGYLSHVESSRKLAGI